MKFEAHIPSSLLSPFIKRYLVVETDVEQINRILPDTSLVMALRFKGQVSQVDNDIKNEIAPSVVSGLRKSNRLMNYGRNTGNVLILFKEAGAQAFIKEPLNEFFGETVPLAAVEGYHDVSLLEEQLSEAANNKQRIDLVENFLLRKLYNSKRDSLILSAIEKIHTAKGLIRIKELVHSLYISQDAFEKRFRKVAGTSPKQFSSIVRMKSLINSEYHNHTLTGLAFDGGYFDQPHFNKEFKLFTGQTPTDFFKSPPRW